MTIHKTHLIERVRRNLYPTGMLVILVGIAIFLALTTLQTQEQIREQKAQIDSLTKRVGGLGYDLDTLINPQPYGQDSKVNQDLKDIKSQLTDITNYVLDVKTDVSWLTK